MEEDTYSIIYERTLDQALTFRLPKTPLKTDVEMRPESVRIVIERPERSSGVVEKIAIVPWARIILIQETIRPTKAP